jgi:hypothetical protein
MSTPAEDSTYAPLTDGTTIEIRPAQPGDFDAVREMYLRMSPDLYLRFFSMGTAAAEREARRICREPGPDQHYHEPQNSHIITTVPKATSLGIPWYTVARSLE